MAFTVTLGTANKKETDVQGGEQSHESIYFESQNEEVLLFFDMNQEGGEPHGSN